MNAQNSGNKLEICICQKIDREEYVEGLRALAVPLYINKKGLQLAIWMIGLKGQIENGDIPLYSSLLKEKAKKIEDRVSFG